MTLVPLIYQEKLFPGQANKFSLGDIKPQLFFSPKDPYHEWIFGAGPVFLLRTTSDNVLSTGKWAAGPTTVGLPQNGPWTYGLLANHLGNN